MQCRLEGALKRTRKGSPSLQITSATNTVKLNHLVENLLQKSLSLPFMSESKMQGSVLRAMVSVSTVFVTVARSKNAPSVA
nr:hypothetical protein [Tanacetum cinerariifolium]